MAVVNVDNLKLLKFKYLSHEWPMRFAILSLFGSLFIDVWNVERQWDENAYKKVKNPQMKTT